MEVTDDELELEFDDTEDAPDLELPDSHLASTSLMQVTSNLKSVVMGSKSVMSLRSCN